MRILNTWVWKICVGQGNQETLILLFNTCPSRARQLLAYCIHEVGSWSYSFLYDILNKGHPHLLLHISINFPINIRFMDTFYISHGSPTLSIDESLPARHFLKSWREKVMGQPPTSILVISGHWETHEPTVNVVPRNDTIYDFYGFPKPMYEVCSLPRFLSSMNRLGQLFLFFLRFRVFDSNFF